MAMAPVQKRPSEGMSFGLPAAVSRNPRTVTAPVGRLQSGGTRLSNLDAHGRLVRKGLTVSFHGLRYAVTKVSRGRCIGLEISPWGVIRPSTHRWLVCESVQVVA